MLLKPRPVFRFNTCIGCGECARCCPPEAIEMIKNKPHVDLEKCIRCYCCQELCPAKAVDIHKPLLNKLFFR
jgi:formate hydrogenlyase subunit 6/NADH:ubiquinone oxidoreductase subunit I